MTVQDTQFPGIDFKMVELESEVGPAGIPCTMEYKVCLFEKDKDWHDMIYQKVKSRGQADEFLDGGGI